MVNAAKPVRMRRVQHGQDHSVQRVTVYKVVSVILLIVLAFLFTFPLYWIITGSFKDQKAVNSAVPQWFPTNPVTRNYDELFKRPAFL